MTIQDFVTKHEISIQSTRIAARPDGKAKEWKAFHYSVTLTHGKNTLTTVYSMGLAHVEKGKAPAGGWAGGETTQNGRKAWHDKLSGELILGRPKLPTAESVLDSLRLDAESANATFEDFCGDLGYDTDSRKALEMYLECQNAGTRLRALLGATYAEFMACEPL